jgi:general secretion pathway protein G
VGEQSKSTRGRGRRRRHSVTLIEMIIVMLLIATITGALALSYQRSLDKGRAFATQQRIERLRAILTLHFSEHPLDQAAGDVQMTEAQYEDIIATSGLGPPNPKDLLRDAWNRRFVITVNANGGDPTITITSLDIRSSNITK